MRHGCSLVACVAVVLGVTAATPAGAAAGIVSRGPASAVTFPSDSTTALTLRAPGGAANGDVLLASIGFGKSGAKAQPRLTAPPGWTLVSSTNQGTVGSLGVFRHVFASGETAYTWNTDVSVGGIAHIAAFGGVDPVNPIDTSSGRTTTGTSIATPSVTTSAAGDMLVASFYGYDSNGRGSSWTPPSGMTELGEASNTSGSRSGSLDNAIQASSGPSGAKTATVSPSQDYAVATLTALRARSGSVQSVPPAISAVQAGAITTTTTTVTWTTDQPSDSQVEYGATTSYGSVSPLNSSAVTSHSQNLAGLAPNTVYHYRVLSRNAAGQLTVSGDYTFQTAASGAATPLIVDTDIVSDADDVGALATAFGLQIRGEAKVVAIGVNTRTSRPAVATNSWRCVAAIAAFYNSSSVPIGSAMPDNGTAVNSPDFVGPCASLAPAATPAPDTAVNVFRRALAAQPDGSVVMASTGYFGNLSALLNSSPDSTSPLSGRDLVAKKVKVLVAMAGGYPQRSGETNLSGDPASAQNVANNWPTKIVWSGYEVGDAVHTGQSISSVHPATSPVRVAYQAFVAPGNWIYSYDLTAVYHAIRPDDSLLAEVGPGTNKVDSSGGNAFTLGSGNQYYLTLSSATFLDSSIEALLDTLPPATPVPPPDTTPPVISGVSAAVAGSSGETVTWTTDEPSTTQVEYGTDASYGSKTTLDSALTTSHSQTLPGLTPGSLYHYRVRSTDAAGNTAVSADYTFTTASTPTSQPVLNDIFDSNVINPLMWVATPSGSTVTAANQELEITHPAGAWTKGALASALSYDDTGKSVQVQVVRAANSGLGGSTYGETSIYLYSDTTHYVTFFIAGGSLTAWVNTGGGEVNLTPSWPSYSATTMQWLRLRESGGKIYFEYASGTTAPGTWTTLASTTEPFSPTALQFEIVAGANVNTSDVAKFDNIATY